MTLAGVPGRAVHFVDTIGGVLRARFCFQKEHNRVFQIWARARRDTSPQRMAAFLDSFALLPDAPPPAMLTAAALANIVVEANRSLPAMIDAATELTNASSANGMFVFNNRLVNMAAADVDVTRLTTMLRPALVTNACAAAETRDVLLKRGVRLQYVYMDKDRKPVAAIEVTPADCGFAAR